MLKDHLVDIYVNKESLGVLFHEDIAPYLVSQTGITPEEAFKWISAIVTHVSREYITYQRQGFGLGMGRDRPVITEDGTEEAWDIPPLMRDFIHMLPYVVFEILYEHKYAAFDLKPINVFCVEKDNPDVMITAYHKDEANADTTTLL